MNTALFRGVIKRHAPAVITVFIGIGIFVTAALSAKAGSETKEKLEEAVEEAGHDLDLVEKVKVLAPVYTPVAISVLLTVGSLAVGRIMDNRIRAEALAVCGMAYKSLERQQKAYEEVVKRKYGEKAHARILQEANILVSNPRKEHEEWCGEEIFGSFDLDEDLRTFFDGYSGQYFKATIGQVMNAEIHMNREFAKAGDVCLKEWYDFLGIPAPENAENLYWTAESVLTFIDFQHYKTTTDDGFECAIVEFACSPYPINYEH